MSTKTELKKLEAPVKFLATPWSQGMYKLLKVDNRITEAYDLQKGMLLEVVIRPVAPGEITPEEAEKIFSEAEDATHIK